MPLAMAYVPWQNWQDIYEVHKGIHRGTIFEELDKPFFGRGGCNR
ncbi:MAG: spore coat associated protein CotJA [Candidatus Ruminococcus intestinipullorum]|nr:spore coat associated protein CotJA [Candidatus Ruminococcus intestinipullorum]